MKCSTCGTDNPANARFCGNCRQPLGEPAEVSTQAKAGGTEPAQESQGRSTRTVILASVQWLWGGFLVIGGLTQLGSEIGLGGLLIMLGGAMSVYSGLLTFKSKKLFGLPTVVGAILLNGVGFVLFVLGIPS